MALVCAEAAAWADDIEVDVLEVFEALLLEMLETCAASSCSMLAPWGTERTDRPQWFCRRSAVLMHPMG